MRQLRGTIMDLNLVFQEKTSRAMTSSALACDYLSSKMTEVIDPLQMSLIAYALDQCGHVSRDQAYHMLRLMNRTGKTSSLHPVFIYT